MFIAWSVNNAFIIEISSEQIILFWELIYIFSTCLNHNIAEISTLTFSCFSWANLYQSKGLYGQMADLHYFHSSAKGHIVDFLSPLLLYLSMFEGY